LSTHLPSTTPHFTCPTWEIKSGISVNTCLLILLKLSEYRYQVTWWSQLNSTVCVCMVFVPYNCLSMDVMLLTLSARASYLWFGDKENNFAGCYTSAIETCIIKYVKVFWFSWISISTKTTKIRIWGKIRLQYPLYFVRSAVDSFVYFASGLFQGFSKWHLCSFI
jgi:hypothetical protein